MANFNSTKICFDYVYCGKPRRVVCEWRDHNIRNFRVELKSHILITYLSTFSTLSLFSIIWLILNQYQAKAVPKNRKRKRGKWSFFGGNDLAAMKFFILSRFPPIFFAKIFSPKSFFKYWLECFFSILLSVVPINDFH